MHHRRTVFASLTVAIVATATLTAATPATSPTWPGDHCAIGVDPIVAGVTPPVEVTCFDTDDEMWSFLTGETINEQTITDDAVLDFNAEITDAASLSGTTPLASTDAAPSTAAASVLLGIEYDGSSYSGTSLAFYGSSGTGCSGGSTYGFSNLGNYGWNDRTSSATSYAGCRGQHYQNISYGGTSITCSPNCSSMGTMNNASSSIVYRP